MLPATSKIKGIHPGVILERELKKRGIKKGTFALTVGEYPQTIGDITKTKRGINPRLSLKLERALNAEEGYFQVLQAYYDIAVAKQKENIIHPTPNLNIIGPSIFWDIDSSKMDFMKRKKFVVARVFERGNTAQIKAIIRFYGKQEIIEIIKNSHTLLFTAINNATKYLKINASDIKCYSNSIQTPQRTPYYTSSRS